MENNNLIQLKTPTIYSFELLRFLAAWSVFFGHYKHFFMYFNISDDGTFYQRFNNPYGGSAVPLFFLMSGMIFTHTYLNQIGSRKISFFQFMKKRFARLYPLHLATLILCAALQAVVFLKTNDYFIYKFNDFKHFILNILFISHWGFEAGNSFNGPIWSVSHEVLLYLLFFVSFWHLTKIKPKVFVPIIVILVLGAIRTLLENNLVSSIFTFFFGVFFYLVLAQILNVEVKIKKYVYLFLWLLLLATFSHKLKRYIPHGAFLPALLGLLLMLEQAFTLTKNSATEKTVRYLGNLSYSTYLLHIPVQLIFLLFSLYIAKLNFTDVSVLLTYLVCVLFISHFSFKYFENPLRVKLSAQKRLDK